jgi:hypothetical protein
VVIVRPVNPGGPMDFRAYPSGMQGVRVDTGNPDGMREVQVGARGPSGTQGVRADNGVRTGVRQTWTKGPETGAEYMRTSLASFPCVEFTRGQGY